MGIYLAGMEMPKSCFYCPFRLKGDPDTFVCLATNEHIEETFAGTIEMRNKGDCPLVPVPNHGRLIDADELILSLMDGGVDGIQTDDYVEIMQIVEDAPTIIPAHKEG